MREAFQFFDYLIGEEALNGVGSLQYQINKNFFINRKFFYFEIHQI